MDDRASAITREFHGDASLAQLLDVFEGQDEKALVIVYGGRTTRSGYHVTEVKAGSFVTLDCGGNPDAWDETILQVEDLEPEAAQTFMTVAKFRSIMKTLGSKVSLSPTARLTFEVGPSEVPMQIFDVGCLRLGAAKVTLEVTVRASICKPRHRETAAVQSYCSRPATTKCC